MKDEYTVFEFAEIMDISAATVEAMCMSQLIAAENRDGEFYIHRDEAIKFLEAGDE